MNFIDANLEDYVNTHSSPEPEVLKELNRETHIKVLQPRMLSGHFQGRLLSFISKLIQPRTILEIGTYTGYSAICLCEGMHPEGKLYTIDINEELTDLQQKYFKKSGNEDRIVSYLGNALNIIPALDFTFDLVFIDADKEDYCAYFDMVIDKLNPGGLLISDNVLWSGKVLDTPDPQDLATQALQAYNNQLREDPRVETIILPVRDGLSLCRKR